MAERKDSRTGPLTFACPTCNSGFGAMCTTVRSGGPTRGKIVPCRPHRERYALYRNKQMEDRRALHRIATQRED